MRSLVFLLLFSACLHPEGESNVSSKKNNPSPATNAPSLTWEWQNPLPQGNNLLAVWGDQKGTIFAVGAGGTILQTTDKGTHWTLSKSPNDLTLSSIYGTGDTVFIGCSYMNKSYHIGDSSDMLLASTNSGATWEVRHRLEQNSAMVDSLQGVDSQSFYSLSSAQLQQTKDGGKTWSFLNGPEGYLHSLWYSDGVLLGGSEAAIYRSEDGGNTWSEHPLSGSRRDDGFVEQVSGIWGNTSSGFYAIGSMGSLFVSRDGKKWSTKKSPLKESKEFTQQLYTISGVSHSDNSTEVYAVGSRGTENGLEGVILQSKNGGDWKQKKTPAAGELRSVWANGDDVYAVGDEGTILYSADKGESWVAQSKNAITSDEAALKNVFGVSEDEIYVGGYGNILYTQNAGDTWSVISKEGCSSAMWASKADGLFCIGSESTLRHTKDAGKTWSTQKLPSPLEALWGFTGGTLIGVGRNGTTLKSKDGGVTWEAFKAPKLTDFDSIWGTSPENFYISGDNGGVWYTNNGGKTWESKPLGTDGFVGRIWGEGNDLFALSFSGVARSINNGPWEMKKISSANLFGLFGSGGAIYAVGAEGIFRSTDKGASWKLQPIHPADNLESVWVSPKGSVFVVGRVTNIIRGKP